MARRREDEREGGSDVAVGEETGDGVDADGRRVVRDERRCARWRRMSAGEARWGEVISAKT